jgi:hypothetical protein
LTIFCIDTFHVPSDVDPFEFKDSRYKAEVIDAMMRSLLESTDTIRLPKFGWVFIPVETDDKTKWRWAKKSGKQEMRELQTWGLAFHVVRTDAGFLTAGETHMLLMTVQRMLIGNGWSNRAKAFTKSGKTRSGVDAPHFGAWSHYAPNLVGPKGCRMTKDTIGQNDALVEDAIKRFLRDFQLVIAPKLCRLLRRLDPMVFRFHQA